MLHKQLWLTRPKLFFLFFLEANHGIPIEFCPAFTPSPPSRALSAHTQYSAFFLSPSFKPTPCIARSVRAFRAIGPIACRVCFPIIVLCTARPNGGATSAAKKRRKPCASLRRLLSRGVQLRFSYTCQISSIVHPVLQW